MERWRGGELQRCRSTEVRGAGASDTEVQVLVLVRVLVLVLVLGVQIWRFAEVQRC